MNVPATYRVFNYSDWCGLAGATKLEEPVKFLDGDSAGPFIREATTCLTHEDATEEVELVISSDERGGVNIGYVMAQGEHLSLRLDEEGGVGAVEINRTGLTYAEADALVAALETLHQNGTAVSVNLLKAMGFSVL